MNEIFKTIWDWFKEKTSSPLYFTYIFFLIIWNWKIFYILFWEDSSLFLSPRTEYISIFEFHIPWNIPVPPPWTNLSLNPIIDWPINTLWHILPPIIFTYFAIVYLPKLHAWAHSIHLGYFYQRKEICAKKELEYQKKYTENLEIEAKEKERQEQQIKKMEKTKIQLGEKWEVEFKKIFSDTRNLEAIDNAATAYYKTRGNFYSSNKNMRDPEQITYISPGDLSRLDAFDIIKIDMAESTLEFTEKGKFFIKRLQEERKIQMW